MYRKPFSSFYTTLVIGLLVSFCDARLFAQNDVRRYSISYVSLGAGINNNYGLSGLSYERIFKANTETNFSLNGGAGISTWGAKLAVELKHYFKSYNKGWACSAGVSWNSGFRNDHEVFEVWSSSTWFGSGGEQDVTVTRLPQANGFVCFYHYWRLGRKENRLSTSLGWSLSLTPDKLRQTAGNPIRKGETEEQNFLLLYAPGGLIVSVAYSLAFLKKENE